MSGWRAEETAPVLRRYAEVRYGAKSWGCERRVSARIEASTMGHTAALTNLGPAAPNGYDSTRTGREPDQAKGQLGPTSWSALANQVRC